MDLMQLPEVFSCNPSLVNGIEEGSSFKLGRSWFWMARETRMPRILGGTWAAWSKVEDRVAQGRISRDNA